MPAGGRGIEPWASDPASNTLPSCSGIVAIGRVKWIEGSKHSRKDNYGWFRFDGRHAAGPGLHPKGAVRASEHCQRPYQAQRSSSRFCSDSRRQRAHRLGVTLA
jgi:hypothetical protein